MNILWSPYRNVQTNGVAHVKRYKKITKNAAGFAKDIANHPGMIDITKTVI